MIDDLLIWNGLRISIVIDPNNYYECEAIHSEICYSRVVRKYIGGKYRFYVQIVFKGRPPVKLNAATGEVKHGIGNGDVGLDIGTRTIAVSSLSDVKIFELADRVQNIEGQKRTDQGVLPIHLTIMKTELLKSKVIRSSYGTNQITTLDIKTS